MKTDNKSINNSINNSINKFINNNYSFTKIDSFNKCNFKYYLNYVKGIYLFKNTIDLEKGTLIHLVLENFINSLKNLHLIPNEMQKLKRLFNKRTSLNILKLKSMLPNIIEEITKYSYKKLLDKNLIEYIKEKDLYEINLSIISFFNNFFIDFLYKYNINKLDYKTELPLQICYNKENNKFIIDCNKNKITGFIDLVILDKENKKAIILDYKTGKGRYINKEQSKLQTIIYSFFIFLKFPFVKNIEVYYYYFKDNTEIHYLFKRETFKKEIKILLQNIRDIEKKDLKINIEKIKKELLEDEDYIIKEILKDINTKNILEYYPKNKTKLCDYCQFKRICDAIN